MTGILVSLAAVVAVLFNQASTPAKGVYTYNLYVTQAVKFQNPDFKACTAADTMTMLNLIYYTRQRHAPAPAASGRAEFRWQPTLSPVIQKAIFRWERRHMSQPTIWPGVDAHGWRNALNYYGWGDIRAGAYADYAYGSFDSAAKAIVHAIAVTDEPVGILAQSGYHAQIVSGYKVSGDDPRTGSTNYRVLGVYLTDPLRERHWANLFVPIEVWKKTDIKKLKFALYLQPDSIYRDPVDGRIGKLEWWHKWVILAPVLSR